MQTETDRIFSYFGPFFAPSLPWKPGKSKFWKIEKTHGDIIILHMCTINEYHMIYVSWDRSMTDIIFLSLSVFSPLIPL